MPRKKSDIAAKDQVLNLKDLKQVLDNAEKQIRLAKQLLFQESYKQKTIKLCASSDVVEGIFDGVDMLGADGKKYSVPSNYASKSKLVAGDVMKLTITSDGIYTYKQIGPVERKRITGVLTENGGDYCVECEGKIFNVLAASVTYFKVKEGDKVTVLVSRDQESNWAAVDNVISGS